MDHFAVDHRPLVATAQCALASHRERHAVEYFHLCGYELKRLGAKNWSLQAYSNSARHLVEDFRPEQVNGQYASLKRVWSRWEWRYIQHLLTQEFEHWIERTITHGSATDSDVVREWVAQGRVKRLPRHLQEDIDIAIMGPVELPRHWRRLAARAAVGEGVPCES